MVHISATRCPQSDGQQPTFSEPSSSWTCPSLRLGSERRSSIVMRSSPCHSFSSHKHAPFSTGAARQLYLVKFRYLALLVFENVKNGFMICGAALTVFFLYLLGVQPSCVSLTIDDNIGGVGSVTPEPMSKDKCHIGSTSVQESGHTPSLVNTCNHKEVH